MKKCLCLSKKIIEVTLGKIRGQKSPLYGRACKEEDV